jgi:hypothetical protein
MNPTESQPPRETIRFDDDMTLLHAYSILQRLNLGVKVRRSVVISGRLLGKTYAMNEMLVRAIRATT